MVRTTQTIIAHQTEEVVSHGYRALTVSLLTGILTAGNIQEVNRRALDEISVTDIIVPRNASSRALHAPLPALTSSEIEYIESTSTDEDERLPRLKNGRVDDELVEHLAADADGDVEQVNGIPVATGSRNPPLQSENTMIPDAVRSDDHSARRVVNGRTSPQFAGMHDSLPGPMYGHADDEHTEHLSTSADVARSDRHNGRNSEWHVIILHSWHIFTDERHLYRQ